jgi:hypothetical protein
MYFWYYQYRNHRFVIYISYRDYKRQKMIDIGSIEMHWNDVWTHMYYNTTSYNIELAVNNKSPLNNHHSDVMVLNDKE